MVDATCVCMYRQLGSGALIRSALRKLSHQNVRGGTFLRDSDFFKEGAHVSRGLGGNHIFLTIQFG